MTLSVASNITTGSLTSAGTAAINVIAIPNGTSTAGLATLDFNDGEGINVNIPVILTGQYSGWNSSPDGDAIKAALESNDVINAKYIIDKYNADEITITQRIHTGNVTISASLTPNSPSIITSNRTAGIAAVGVKDKDKFTITNAATSNGAITVRISDDTGLANMDVVVLGIVTTDSKAQIATKIANALNLNSAISAKYVVTASGDDVELETKFVGANSVTVSLQ